jgi:hypothetical protein
MDLGCSILALLSLSLFLSFHFKFEKGAKGAKKDK